MKTIKSKSKMQNEDAMGDERGAMEESEWRIATCFYGASEVYNQYKKSKICANQRKSASKSL